MQIVRQVNKLTIIAEITISADVAILERKTIRKALQAYTLIIYRINYIENHIA